MIVFKKTILNDEQLFKTARNGFHKCINNMYADHKLYKDCFGDHQPGEIQCELVQISYLENYEIEELHYFDQTTEYNISVNLYGIVLDKDNDKELACYYAMIFDDDLNMIDDHLVTDQIFHQVIKLFG